MASRLTSGTRRQVARQRALLLGWPEALPDARNLAYVFGGYRVDGDYVASDGDLARLGGDPSVAATSAQLRRLIRDCLWLRRQGAARTHRKFTQNGTASVAPYGTGLCQSSGHC